MHMFWNQDVYIFRIICKFQKFKFCQFIRIILMINFSRLFWCILHIKKVHMFWCDLFTVRSGIICAWNLSEQLQFIGSRRKLKNTTTHIHIYRTRTRIYVRSEKSRNSTTYTHTRKLQFPLYSSTIFQNSSRPSAKCPSASSADSVADFRCLPFTSVTSDYVK